MNVFVHHIEKPHFAVFRTRPPLARFGAVARILVAQRPATEEENPDEMQEADIGAALAAFEAWYAAVHGRSFWVLFEHYIPETPRVDF